jgi:hypothetical protein
VKAHLRAHPNVVGLQPTVLSSVTQYVPVGGLPTEVIIKNPDTSSSTSSYIFQAMMNVTSLSLTSSYEYAVAFGGAFFTCTEKSLAGRSPNNMCCKMTFS